MTRWPTWWWTYRLTMVVDMVVDAEADKVADWDRSGQTETDRDRTGQTGISSISMRGRWDVGDKQLQNRS